VVQAPSKAVPVGIAEQVSGSGVKPYGSVGTMPQGKKASPGTEATDDTNGFA